MQISKDIDHDTNIVPIDFDCFYQNEDFEWIENAKCTPWYPTSKSIKAG